MQQYKALKDFEVGPEESHTNYETGAIFDDSNINLDIPALLADGSIEAIELVDHVITQEDLDLNPSLVTEGVKVGDVIGLPPLSDEPLTDEQKSEIEKEHPGSFPEVVEPTIVASETTPDATLLYKGKKVISTTVSAINGIEYQQLILEDSSIVNLTQADYDKEVSVA